jgi:hypothetical protein
MLAVERVAGVVNSAAALRTQHLLKGFELLDAPA